MLQSYFPYSALKGKLLIIIYKTVLYMIISNCLKAYERSRRGL